ncbi:3'-5' exonuclease [Marinoscillum sp. MHG1-6]|uniref:3'-5' exonuclease n=1 Tax=Marinoscillum sp. MHG1-6 TaxID=2959627 RepID=UPI00215856AE|nr:3'-5' exonuclease [Marinoscillum sp. MHG1-6]
MVPETFTAIDFETAQRNPASICQVGLVRVEDGVVVETFNELVRPPDNYYFYQNIGVHGIKPEDTMDAPTFEVVWHQFKHWIIDQVVVAHNANFDFTCLKHALAYYDEIQPEYEGKCTLRIYRRGLAYLSKKHKISLNHHDALSDANACAMLYLKHLKHVNLPRTGMLFN